MGGKSGSAQSKEAKRARAEEEARQQRIREGTADINKIFDGGTSVTGLLGTGAAYDPNATYYNADGSVWAPSATATAVTPAADTSGTSTSNLGALFGRREDRLAASREKAANASTGQTPALLTPEQQFADMVNSGKLYSGTQSGSGFNDDFFANIRNSYTDYALPQLNEQRDTAAKDLTFSLARSGLLNSSARAQKTGELQKLFDTNEQQVRDQALAYENEARNNVESARSDLITTLNATGDNQQAVNSALSRATILTQPQAYSPLGQLFTDFTAGLNTQAAQERAAAASGGMYSSKYNTGLFGGKSNVVTRY